MRQQNVSKNLDILVLSGRNFDFEFVCRHVKSVTGIGSEIEKTTGPQTILSELGAYLIVSYAQKILCRKILTFWYFPAAILISNLSQILKMRQHTVIVLRKLIVNVVQRL